MYNEFLLVAPKPEDHGLPNDYNFAKNFWGDSFYKLYGPRSYLEAKALCESDNATLATPRSDDENAFIAGLISETSIITIWIGVNDIDENNKWISVSDDREVKYTNWNKDQPSGFYKGREENGVEIYRPGFHGLGGLWNDREIAAQNEFICLYDIEY